MNFTFHSALEMAANSSPVVIAPFRIAIWMKTCSVQLKRVDRCHREPLRFLDKSTIGPFVTRTLAKLRLDNLVFAPLCLGLRLVELTPEVLISPQQHATVVDDVELRGGDRLICLPFEIGLCAPHTLFYQISDALGCVEIAGVTVGACGIDVPVAAGGLPPLIRRS
ncbi:hypothetical protein BPNPMPFG_006585 (plasmid) [Mesorhizobium sp. AR07]|uniref:hypothetical protein n=1 Tax=Mesorhizobium sp. AR07 TaxID=2865838 RepID=UPI00215E8FBE|nr:hypothetical protein [Mesorhizobium sp. AR07]UVK48956.1 hypothetical protein BPNPMPFG_006585 [Mesorhizobium sp. AR07]